MTSAGALVSAATQATKQRWNASASSVGKNIAEMIVRGRAFAKGRNRRRNSIFFSPNRAMSTKRLRPGQHREQAQQQHLVERIGHLAALAGVRQILEIIQKNNRLVDRPDSPPPPNSIASSHRIRGSRQIQHFSRLSPTSSPDCPAVSG